LFGHVAWGIARHEGDDEVHSFLKAFEDEPPFIISSAFPRDCLPMPQLAPSPTKVQSYDEYQFLKKRRKMRYVPVVALQAGVPILPVLLQEIGLRESKCEVQRQSLHNTVDRLGAGTLEDTGLFERTELWMDHRDVEELPLRPVPLDIYILSTFSIERVDTLVRWAFEAGFGAKSSSGAGQVLVQRIEECSLPEKGNRAMALAPFVPTPGEARNLRADIFVRRGKLGWEFGSEMNPFKKPIVFYSEGSTFDTTPGTRWAGTLVSGIHADHRIRQQGMAPLAWITDGGIP